VYHNVHNQMRPLVQPWHTAVVQVAPPDLEDLYLCAALSCCKLDIPLCTTANIMLDENIFIYGDDTKAVHRLGFDSKYFGEGSDGEPALFKHLEASSYLNVLIPGNAVFWSRNQYIEDEAGWRAFKWPPIFKLIMDRLDDGEYLWARTDLFLDNPDLLVIQGFMQSH